MIEELMKQTFILMDLIDLMSRRLDIFNMKEGWFFKMEEREGEYIQCYGFHSLLTSYSGTSRSEWGDECSRAGVRWKSSDQQSGDQLVRGNNTRYNTHSFLLKTYINNILFTPPHYLTFNLYFKVHQNGYKELASKPLYNRFHLSPLQVALFLSLLLFDVPALDMC